MISHPRPQRSLTAGFTLLETLVVVVILAFAAAIAMPMFIRPSDGMRLQTTARGLINAMRLTRATAIVRGTEMALTIDVDKRTFSSAAIQRQSFDPEITVKLTFAQPEQTARSTGGFRFFSDGSSSGGDIHLQLHGREATICVNWLTGEPQLVDRC
jgi:general secretion pathway protein H